MGHWRGDPQCPGPSPNGKGSYPGQKSLPNKVRLVNVLENEVLEWDAQGDQAVTTTVTTAASCPDAVSEDSLSLIHISEPTRQP